MSTGTPNPPFRSWRVRGMTSWTKGFQDDNQYRFAALEVARAYAACLWRDWEDLVGIEITGSMDPVNTSVNPRS